MFHIFSPALNFAERALGLTLNSSREGKIGFLVRILPSPASAFSRKKFLTILSSKEWNEITAIRPPGSKNLQALSIPSFKDSNSSLTAMRRAWKVLVAKWSRLLLYQSGTAWEIISISSKVVLIGFFFLVSHIFLTMLPANLSSPYFFNISVNSFSENLFIKLAAVSDF